jgi:hypothetical protein
LARFDGNLKAAAEAQLDIEELLSALADGRATRGEDRQGAIACFLSASEGWRDAKTLLKGAFARMPNAAWLKDDKD